MCLKSTFSWLRTQIQNILTFLLLLPCLLYSQADKDKVDEILLPEKVYIQLSSKVYATDQAIWFKAVVVEAENHEPTKISRVLYVDLIDPNKQVIAQKLVKLDNGIGHGAFNLNENLELGKYQIRAYTRWNMNFGDNFMFKSHVDIVASKEKDDKSFIHSLSLVESESDPGTFFLKGQFIPRLHKKGQNKKEFKAYLDWGTGKDTLSIKNTEGKYTLDYEVSDSMGWVNLTIDGGAGLNYSKKIIVNNNALDVRFFPESGVMLGGIVNRLGVKVVAPNGKGKLVSGQIFDKLGNMIAVFRTNHLGMGTFYLKPDSSETYFAKILLSDGTTLETQYALPSVVSKGSILSINKNEDKVNLMIRSSELKGLVYIKVNSRGTDYYLIEGAIKDGGLKAELSLNEMPEGIIEFTLLDESKNPIAERLYFNESKKDRLNIVLNTDKSIYGNREKTEVDINVTANDQKNVSNVNLSVLSINKKYWRNGLDENIYSYLLLNSELRGAIQDPGYYFREDNANRFQDIDALLLTQGWRNYVYPIKRKSSNWFLAEPGLTVRGKVVSNFNRKKKQKNDTINVSMLTSGKTVFVDNQNIDSSGRFNFLLPDIHGDKVKFFLQAKGSSDKKNDYRFSLEEQLFPKVSYDANPLGKEVDTIIRVAVKDQKRREHVKMVFDSLYGVTQLEEVLIKGYKMTPEQKLISKKYGEPDVIIEGDSIRKKEKKWSYGLFSILLFNYQDQIEIEQFSDGFMLAHIRGGKDEPTLLMVDGRLLEKDEYELVPNMTSDIIERIDIIRNAKFFKSRYLEVFPDANPLFSPYMGHILSIYTKGKVGISGTYKSLPGTLNTMIDAFSPVKEFYAPKYDVTDSDNAPPDLRNLIYWNPTISSGINSSISVDFFNGDVEGDYIILVEAISSQGHIGYGELEYRVGE